MRIICLLLNCFIYALRFVPPRLVDESSSYVDPALQQAEYVFVRNDATRPTSTKVYFGPIKVVHTTGKYFTSLQNDNFNNVYIHKLKDHLPSLENSSDKLFPDIQSSNQLNSTNDIEDSHQIPFSRQ